ncbi:MAG TPA: hypothetical protein VFW40_11545 [Capsulimonadaceae bacterium]|nr:hypothetical protein [Capsulimonadaceae bacterium]
MPDEYEHYHRLLREIEELRADLFRLHHHKETYSAMPQIVFKDNQKQPFSINPSTDDAKLPGALPDDLVVSVTDNPNDFKITPNPNGPEGPAKHFFIERIDSQNADPNDGSEVATVEASSPSNPNFTCPPQQFLAQRDVASSATIEADGDPVELPGPAASIAITGISATAAVSGAAEQGVATVTDANGNPVDPQPAITWSGDLPSGGTLTDTGLYTPGPNAGPDTITATDGALSDSVTVTVS